MEILLSIFLIFYLIYLICLALYINFCQKKIIYISELCHSILLMKDQIKSMLETTYKQLDYIEQAQSYHQKYLEKILDKLNNDNQETLQEQTLKSYRPVPIRKSTIKENIMGYLKIQNKPVSSSDILEYLMEYNDFKPQHKVSGLIHVNVELRNLLKKGIVTKYKRKGQGQRIKWELSHGKKH